jgi:hypothetical protein
MDEDCVEVDGAWYEKEGNMIAYNHTSKQWVLKHKNKNMIRGIIDFKSKDVPVTGYFTPRDTDAVDVFNLKTGEQFKCVSAEIAKKGGCEEDLSTGIYYFNIPAGTLSALRRISNKIDNKAKGYNIEDNVDEMAQKTAAYNSYTPVINRQTVMFSKLLGDISFGVENEAIAGYLPNYIQNRTGVVVCRDGSLHAPDGTQGPRVYNHSTDRCKGCERYD